MRPAKPAHTAFPDHPNRGVNWSLRPEVVHVAADYAVDGFQVCERCGGRVSAPSAPVYEPGTSVAVVDRDPNASWRCSRAPNCEPAPHVGDGR